MEDGRQEGQDRLANMDGRLYDYALARFLSPDNHVQEPGNSQNFNRYSYCLNNPLNIVLIIQL
jgi:RHS repeat-associated protein